MILNKNINKLTKLPDNKRVRSTTALPVKCHEMGFVVNWCYINDTDIFFHYTECQLLFVPSAP